MEYLNKVIKGDCLKVMPKLPDESVDAVICDLPYGTTMNSWDSVIPLDQLWEEYKRIIKPKANIILFSSQPFTHQLIGSNFDWFRYEIIWLKDRSNQFVLASVQPMKIHENILVFFEKRGTFNPQMRLGHQPYERMGHMQNSDHLYGVKVTKSKSEGERFPLSVVFFPRNWRHQDSLHPTQKPVELMEWLVRTYTNENDVVLDNACGSGGTGVACINANRKYVLIEKRKKYAVVASRRITKLRRKVDVEKKMKLW